MTSDTGYTFRLDDAEIRRFESMAVHAQQHEAALWATAGITENATVVDLGCGPGALFPRVAERIGAQGSILAVDADPDACDRARRAGQSLDCTVRVIQADVTATGLPAGVASVVLCRHVLVHNGQQTGAVLAECRRLLRPGGHLVSVEPDVDGIDFGAASAERCFEQRWVAMMRADGNDPSLGRERRLQKLLRSNGWDIVDSLAWTDALVIDKSPSWAAADAIVQRGFATANEMQSWRDALERRQAEGPLRCSVGMTAVVAEPGPPPPITTPLS